MKSGISNIMKQAQEMQANMEKAKKELAKTEVTGSSGSDMVQIIMTGNHLVNRVEIHESLMKDDKEILEDLIVVAIYDANKRVEKVTQDRMSNVSSGMGLPPGVKLPF